MWIFVLSYRTECIPFCTGGRDECGPQHHGVSSEQWALSSELWAGSWEQWGVRSGEWAGSSELLARLAHRHDEPKALVGCKWTRVFKPVPHWFARQHMAAHYKQRNPTARPAASPVSPSCDFSFFFSFWPDGTEERRRSAQPRWKTFDWDVDAHTVSPLTQFWGKKTWRWGVAPAMSWMVKCKNKQQQRKNTRPLFIGIVCFSTRVREHPMSRGRRTFFSSTCVCGGKWPWTQQQCRQRLRLGCSWCLVGQQHGALRFNRRKGDATIHLIQLKCWGKNTNT